MKSNQNNLNTQSLIIIRYQKHFLANNILGRKVSLLQPDFMNKISNKLFPTEIKMNFILHHFGEWLSGLRRYIQNREIPSSNPTARSVGLGVLTLLQSSRWPSGRIHNMGEKHRVAKAVSLSVAQSWSWSNQMNDKKRIRGDKRNFTTNESSNKNHSRILKLFMNKHFYNTILTNVHPTMELVTESLKINWAF